MTVFTEVTERGLIPTPSPIESILQTTSDNEIYEIFMGVSTTTMNNYLTMRPPNFLRITTVSTYFDLPNKQA